MALKGSDGSDVGHVNAVSVRVHCVAGSCADESPLLMSPASKPSVQRQHRAPQDLCG